MASSGFQIWEFVASVVGTVITIPLLYTWIVGMMPTAKMSALDALLSETEALLRSALEEGTIDYSYYDRNFRDRIWFAKLHADDYRAQVYNITGWWHALRLWMSGLSGKITAITDVLHEIRGMIARSSSRGRQHLNKLGCTSNPTLVEFMRRDRVSSMAMPLAPSSTAESPLQAAREEGTQENGATEYTAIAAPWAHAHAATKYHTHATHLAHTDAELHYEEGMEAEAQTLPPLAFPNPSKVHIVSHTRHATRICLRRSGNKQCVHGAEAERRGFPSPFRIFSGFLHRSSSATRTLPATVPAPASLLPATLSEKGAHLYATTSEERGHVVVQLTLPA